MQLLTMNQLFPIPAFTSILCSFRLLAMEIRKQDEKNNACLGIHSSTWENVSLIVATKEAQNHASARDRGDAAPCV
ncbi:unnamed protein product [Danaus chrysippus]|uniref:(African queen) hypothetical protein n=1 Tax=Danaus chrysippus TaxID=151541 RepID=A0A8J2VUI4_9NEOP|nr:unnamed protein product [Danaus chrysippus]